MRSSISLLLFLPLCLIALMQSAAAIPWEGVIEKPEYQSLSNQEKAEAQEQYFNEVVAPLIESRAAQELARVQFYKQYPPASQTEVVNYTPQSEVNSFDQFDEPHQPKPRRWDAIWQTLTKWWFFFAMAGLVLLVGAVIHILFMKLNMWMTGRYQKQIQQDMCRDLAIHEISDSEHEKVITYLSGKYSSEMLRNRLSDFVGLLLNITGTVVELGLIVFVGYVVYIALSRGYDGEWSALWLATLFHCFYIVLWLVVVIFCKFLTNRFPNEAKLYNQRVDMLIKQFTIT